MRKPDDPTSSTDGDSSETFLGRWSRRKRAGDAESVSSELPAAQALQREHETHSEPEREPAARAESLLDPPALTEDADPAPVLTDADMPPLTSIGDDGDYSGFLSPGVSEALRNKALRQLFMSAQFNVLDGLNDYDDDFTAFESLGDIITSDMRHRTQMEAEQAAREAQSQRLARDESAQAMPGEEGIAEQQSAAADAMGDDGAGSADDEQIADSPGTEAETSDVDGPDIHDAGVGAGPPDELTTHEDGVATDKGSGSATTIIPGSDVQNV